MLSRHLRHFSTAAAKNKPSPSSLSPPPPQTYQNSKSIYQQKLKTLRKLYYKQHQAHVQKSEQLRLQEEARIQKLSKQHQHEKYLKAIQSAYRQEEFRLEQQRKFENHLKNEQIKRDQRKELMQKARLLVIQELEEEAPFWMVTHDEVEERLGRDDAMQALWAKPNHVGVLPEDAIFWRFESETMDMSRSYKTTKELLLEEIVENCALESNVDLEYWNEERTNARFMKEKKALLRGLVRKEGRKALLERQADWMKDMYERRDMVSEGIPVKIPPPNLKVLANEKAMEEEGARLILENPHEFLEMEDGKVKGLKRREEDSFPMIVGMEPMKDSRTKKQRKKDARQLEVQAKKEAQEGNLLGMFDEDESFEPYREAEPELPEDVDPEVAKSMDPNEIDGFTEEEIEWVVEQLDHKIKMLKNILKHESKDDIDMSEEDRELLPGEDYGMMVEDPKLKDQFVQKEKEDKETSSEKDNSLTEEQDKEETKTKKDKRKNNFDDKE